MNKYDEAIVCFDKAIEINDKYTNSYYNKALILFELKKYNESIEVINMHLKIDDKNSNSYYYKGLSLFELKNMMKH
ncbi:tetratricopeptide repeat protein [Brachyspira alvinipulli]|uniref:tetratricopeptide repeat protein n=1 Tax=Brachyspira alvinipulli TaxID=84379 RepID=UPI0004844FC8|nr:CDC27 family protein [Brachyspira alvinipulli]